MEEWTPSGSDDSVTSESVQNENIQMSFPLQRTDHILEGINATEMNVSVGLIVLYCTYLSINTYRVYIAILILIKTPGLQFLCIIKS